MNIDKFIEKLGMDLDPVYRDRLKSELQVICNNDSGINLLPYFLTLADIMSFARKNGIITSPNRGSSGGSLFAYILGITDTNPLKYDIPFSRFLSEARIRKGSLPDIDVDIPTSKRKIILDYIFNKYGDKAAHVAVFSTLRLKNSFQDVFRALITQPKEFEIKNLQKNGNIQESDRLQRELDKQTEDFNLMRKSLDTLVPGVSDKELIHGYTLDDVKYPGLIESNKLFADWAKEYPHILAMTEKVLGLPRQIGTHAGGIVISPISLPEVVPVFKDEGVNCIAYDKKVAAKHGLIKYDLLGVTSLDYVQSCIDLLKERGTNLDIHNLPENSDMYSVFTDGKCSSLFQWSTSGGARFAKELNPKCLEDLIAGVALNRPGALDAVIKTSDEKEMVAATVYLKRKSGELKVEYLHDDLKPILEKSYGIFVMQESIMETMQKLLNYSEEEADDVRSKISEKDVKAFEKIKKDAQVLLNKGWTQKQIDELCQQISAFSRYAFNLSHSVGYGTLSYITGWLKYHHPLEWWCSVLTHSSLDKQIEYYPEIYQLVGTPDINELSENFKIKNNKLVPPLTSIKGVGEAVIREINSKGPFESIQDFFNKTSRRTINIGVVQKLCIAGALDSILGDYQKLRIENKLKYVLSFLKLKEEIPERLQNLTPYEWYKVTKQILPSSSLSLYEAIKKTPSVKMPFIEKEKFLEKLTTYSAFRGKTHLVDGKGLLDLLELVKVLKERESFTVCCYGFVKDLRRFSYKNNSKSAVEINCDIDFLPIKSVVWPKGDYKQPECYDFINDNECYLFFLKIRNEEGKEIQILDVKSIIIEKPKIETNATAS